VLRDDSQVIPSCGLRRLVRVVAPAAVTDTAWLILAVAAGALIAAAWVVRERAIHRRRRRRSEEEEGKR
jgi:hypothetical protein